VSPPVFSIVIPVLNEAENIRPVTEELLAALAGSPDPFELVFVDDGSRDGTPGLILTLKQTHPQIRLIQHPQTLGKSMAMRTGAKAARASWIVNIDGDGQNDPADILPLLRLRDGLDAGLIAGVRRKRQDTLSKRLASRFANRLRRKLLNDDCPDTACGFKIYDRATFLDLPSFEGQHRFLPALFKLYGKPVICAPVTDRLRQHGVSKYTNFGRAMVGIGDLFGVIWLKSRTPAPPPAPLEK
jgi:dolichol-phosphate mannosyltransferase